MDKGTIVFVSLELPGGWPVSARFSRLSQPETVSKFETVGSWVQAPSKAVALGQAGEDRERGLRPGSQLSYGSRRRKGCWREARSGRDRSWGVQESPKTSLPERRS